MAEKINGLNSTDFWQMQELKPTQNKPENNLTIFENTCKKGGKNPCMPVIDGFKIRSQDVDGNKETREIYHGEAVVNFVKARALDTDFIKYDVTNGDSGSLFSDEKIIAALQDILQRIKKGERIDAVNLSAQKNNNIKNPYTRENLADKRSELKEQLDDITKQEVELIEQIVKEGTPVFVAAGNAGKNMYNQFNLAEGATNVGSTHKDSEDNSLVNSHGKFSYDIKIISSDKEKNTTCFDYTEDIKADYCGEYVDPEGFSNTISGTSFTTPTAAGNYLNRKYRKE